MRYTDEFMEALRQVGDPSLDPIMQGLVAGKGLEAVNAALRTAVTNARAVPESLPADLREWLAREARLPDGVDRKRLDRASAFFVDHAVSLSAILGLASLPECYAAKKGVKALHATDQMGYSGTEKRVSETSQFLLHVLTPGGLYDEGAGIATLMKVRMMHSASRLLIGANDWDAARDGVPVNQEDLIGTLTTFGCTPVMHITKLGVTVSPEEQEDFWYFWRIAGQILGIDVAAMPVDFAEAKVFFERVQHRHCGKSSEGIELTKALLSFYAGIVPGASLFEGLVPGVVRFLAGDVVADALEVPQSRWKGIIEGNRLVFRMLQGIQTRSTVLNGFVNKMGVRLLTHEAVRMGGGRTAEFRIPETLRRAWRLPPHGSAPKTARVVREISEAVHAKLGGRKIAVDTVVDLAVLVANADGEVDDFETEALVEALAGMTGADAAAARAKLVASLAVLKKKGAAHRTSELARILPELDIAEDGLSLAIAMAYANSGIAKEERAAIESLSEQMGFSAERLEERVRATCSRIERHEVSPA